MPRREVMIRKARSRTARAAPLPPALPRATKRVRGRTPAPPAHIRVIGAASHGIERDDIARKLARRLARFGPAIERISVRLVDVNGPKGGVDQMCLVKVVLRGLPSVVVERRAPTMLRAVDAAMDPTANAVKRVLQRRRLKPLRARDRAAKVAAMV